jgi:hypothetical protein
VPARGYPIGLAYSRSGYMDTPEAALRFHLNIKQFQAQTATQLHSRPSGRATGATTPRQTATAALGDGPIFWFRLCRVRAERRDQQPHEITSPHVQPQAIPGFGPRICPPSHRCSSPEASRTSKNDLSHHRPALRSAPPPREPGLPASHVRPGCGAEAPCIGVQG